MSLRLHLAARCLGWTSLAFLLALGLAGLAGLVEGVRFGMVGALGLSLRETLPLVLPLAPLLCAVGAGAAAARTAFLGEALALQALGLDPRRVALIAGAVALVLTLLAGGIRLLVVPPLAESALALRVEMGEAPPPSDWLWTGGEAVRVLDGTTVSVEGGEVTAVVAGTGRLPTALVRQARSLRMPFVAHPADLGLALPVMQAELWSRLAAVPAAALLAMLAWLGLGGPGRVGSAIALGLAWQSATIILNALAAASHLSPVLASGLPLLALGLLLGWRVRV